LLPKCGTWCIINPKGGDYVVLFKCECGCYCSIKEDKLIKEKIINCQNCTNSIELKDSIPLDYLTKFKEYSKSKGFALTIIPDETTFEINFSF